MSPTQPGDGAVVVYGPSGGSTPPGGRGARGLTSNTPASAQAASPAAGPLAGAPGARPLLNVQAGKDPLSAARKHPTVSKLLDNWDEFEGSLRREADKRWKSLATNGILPTGLNGTGSLGVTPGALEEGSSVASAVSSRAGDSPTIKAGVAPRMRRAQSAQDVRALRAPSASPEEGSPEAEGKRTPRSRRHKRQGSMHKIPEAAAGPAPPTAADGGPLFKAIGSLNLLPGTNRPLFPVASAPSLNFSLNGQSQDPSAGDPADLDALTEALAAKARGALSSAQTVATNCSDNFKKLGTLVEATGASALTDLSRLLTEPGAVARSPSPGDDGSAHGSNALAIQGSGGKKKPARAAAAKGDGGVEAEMAAAPEEKRSRGGWRLGGNGGEQAPYRSLREEGRNINIVTTAGLPWMTGTAINPLLRAAYLAQGGKRSVRLLVPWLSEPDQRRVFPNDLTFKTPEDQEKHIREWLHKRVGFQPDFKLSWYPGRYAAEKGSIMPVGDPTKYVPDAEADIAVLEEPEHLNWYHHGTRWTDKFHHVVGVMHTNYLDYVSREEHGDLKAALAKRINQWVCRSHCHKVIKLSDAVQDLPRQETMFVHGVSPSFLEVGARKAEASLQLAEGEAQPAPAGGAAAGGGGRKAKGAKNGRGGNGRDKDGADEAATPWAKGAYFLGKAVWAKGYTELLDLMEQHCSRARDNGGAAASGVGANEGGAKDGDKTRGRRGGAASQIDIFGSGPDMPEIRAGSDEKGLPLNFHGAIDHADSSLHDYKVFINPSLSDVVATTTAEALAMGKFVIVHEHPCNQFFSTFDNCLIYRTPEEFSEKLTYALAHDPRPMSASERHRLTWDAATERFLDIAELKASEQPGPLGRALDNGLWALHNGLVGNEGFRLFAGAGPGTRDNPSSVTSYVATESSGSFFDNKERAAKVHAKAAQRAGAPPPVPDAPTTKEPLA